MKTLRFSASLLCLLALCTLFVLSCQKEQTSSKSSQQPVDDELKTQLMNSTNFIYQSGNLSNMDLSANFGNNAHGVTLQDRSSADDCKTITYSGPTDVYPYTKTVVFNNCSNCDSDIVNGTIVTTYYVDTANATPGALLTTAEYINYTVDGIKVSGTESTYLLSKNPYAFREITQKQLVDPGADGGIRTYRSSRTWVLIQGQGTAETSDDVYGIRGTSSGTEVLRGGYVASFTSIISASDPIISTNDCCWKTSGTETINITVKSRGGYSLTEVLDFGDGTCDNVATLTINGGDPQEVTLPLRFYPLATP